MRGQKPVGYRQNNSWYFEYVEVITHNFGRNWNIRHTGAAFKATEVNKQICVFKQHDKRVNTVEIDEFFTPVQGGCQCSGVYPGRFL
jgi:hypothetical protein